MSEEGTADAGSGDAAGGDTGLSAEAAGELEATLGDGDTGGETVSALSIDALPAEMASQMVTFQVNGETVTMPLGEALKGSQRMKAATQKEMAAAHHRREADAMVEAQRTEFEQMIADPAALFERGGAEAVERNLIAWIDSDNPELKAAATRAMEAIERRYKMSPEQRTLEDDRAKFAKERAKFAEKEAEEARRNESAATAEHREAYKTAFDKAVADKGMTPSSYTLQRMAMTMSAALSEGVELSPAQAADIVQQERGQEIGHHVAALDGDALLSFLGPDAVRRVNKAAIARARRGTSSVSSEPTTRDVPRPAEPRKRPMTTEELRKKWASERGR